MARRSNLRPSEYPTKEIAMRVPLFLFDSERWDWFAAGDEEIAKPTPRSAPNDNSVERILFELGLVFAIPLASATLIGIIFGA
jgi:hypothetical protein